MASAVTSDIVEIDGIAFYGAFSEQFALSRLTHWKAYHPDIRNALTSRGFTLMAIEGTTDTIPPLSPNSKPVKKEGRDQLLIARLDKPGCVYAVDSPGYNLSRARFSASFDETVALALNHIFGSSNQPGFKQARDADVTISDSYRTTHRLQDLKAFTEIWSNMAARPGEAHYNRNIASLAPRAFEWVTNNALSPYGGITLNRRVVNGGYVVNRQIINTPDLAGRTPLWNLTFPEGGNAGLSAEELAVMIGAGANPFQPNPKTGKSVISELKKRKDPRRLAVLVQPAVTETATIFGTRPTSSQPFRPGSPA